MSRMVILGLSDVEITEQEGAGVVQKMLKDETKLKRVANKLFKEFDKRHGVHLCFDNLLADSTSYDFGGPFPLQDMPAGSFASPSGELQTVAGIAVKVGEKFGLEDFYQLKEIVRASNAAKNSFVFKIGGATCESSNLFLTVVPESMHSQFM
jgi:hypothetical protein